MKKYALFGMHGISLEAVRIAVEETLGIRFTPHESLYAGEYYVWGETAGKNLVLQENFDPLEKEWAEEEFQHCEVLLYANEVEDPEKLEGLLSDQIANISLLKQEEF